MNCRRYWARYVRKGWIQLVHGFLYSITILFIDFFILDMLVMRFTTTFASSSTTIFTTPIFFAITNPCRKSILIGSLIKNVILTHQKPTLLFYHIILQYTIYQMFYSFILNIKIIYIQHIKIIYLLKLQPQSSVLQQIPNPKTSTKKKKKPSTKPHHTQHSSPPPYPSTTCHHHPQVKPTTTNKNPPTATTTQCYF